MSYFLPCGTTSHQHFSRHAPSIPDTGNRNAAQTTEIGPSCVGLQSTPTTPRLQHNQRGVTNNLMHSSAPVLMHFPNVVCLTIVFRYYYPGCISSAELLSNEGVIVISWCGWILGIGGSRSFPSVLLLCYSTKELRSSGYTTTTIPPCFLSF